MSGKSEMILSRDHIEIVLEEHDIKEIMQIYRTNLLATEVMDKDMFHCVNMLRSLERYLRSRLVEPNFKVELV